MLVDIPSNAGASERRIHRRAKEVLKYDIYLVSIGLMAAVVVK